MIFDPIQNKSPHSPDNKDDLYTDLSGFCPHHNDASSNSPETSRD